MTSQGIFNIIAFVLLLVGTICWLFSRRKSWALALWFPLLTISGILLYELQAPLSWRDIFPVGYQRPDYGFVTMGIGFYLMFAIPVAIVISICLIITLAIFPKGNAWRYKGVWAGISSSALILAAAWSFLSDPKITVQILDTNDQPLPNVRVKFTTYQSLGDHIIRLGIKVTDQNGKVSMRVPYDSWTATVWLPDNSWQADPSPNKPFRGRKAWIGMGTDRDHNRLLRLSEGWYQADWGRLAPRYVRTGDFEKKRDFKIKIRTKNELVSSDIQQILHQRLLNVLHEPDKYSHVLDDEYGELDIFNEFPLFMQIFQEHPKFQSDKLDFIRTTSDWINGCWTSTLEKTKNNSDSGGFCDYRALCQWLNLDSSSQAVPQSVPRIQAQLKQMAEPLLDLEKSNWKNANCQAFGKLAHLVKNRIPEFLTIMVSVSKEQNFNQGQVFSLALEQAQPDVEQVRAYFDNANPTIALSAIQAVSRKLKGSDAVAALERISSLAGYLDYRSKERVNIDATLDGLVYKILDSALDSFTAEELTTSLACVQKMPCANNPSIKTQIQRMTKKLATATPVRE
ncbi:MAG: hypothetical protein LBH01_05310 [Verrucomicrobiales bacterium]|jgi:hypothetical protein|nr:hypothetical protein [Verrucomicrobiales bacterium]